VDVGVIVAVGVTVTVGVSVTVGVKVGVKVGVGGDVAVGVMVAVAVAVGVSVLVGVMVLVSVAVGVGPSASRRGEPVEPSGPCVNVVAVVVVVSKSQESSALACIAAAISNPLRSVIVARQTMSFFISPAFFETRMCRICGFLLSSGWSRLCTARSAPTGAISIAILIRKSCCIYSPCARSEP